MVRISRMLAVSAIAGPLLAACATIPPTEEPVSVIASAWHCRRRRRSK